MPYNLPHNLNYPDNVVTGGQGKRRLTVLSPDFNDGYTATLIRSATGGGKNTLYAIPLQYHFDMTPLPPDALEFLNTPKERCQKCRVPYPLHFLQGHIRECEQESSSEDEDYEVSVTIKY